LSYTADGDFSIDNNIAENLMRPIALGRKNWLFFGSDNGGRTAAILFTITQSAKRHGLNVFNYLKDIIARISDHPAKQLHLPHPGHLGSEIRRGTSPNAYIIPGVKNIPRPNHSVLVRSRVSSGRSWMLVILPILLKW